MITTAGSTDVSVPFYFVDDVGGTAPGEPTTGLLFSNIETGGSASYQLQGAARVDFTAVTLASAAAAHADGGFVEVDGTEMPGVYRLDIPDAAVAAGADFVIVYLRAAVGSNTVARPLKIDLTAVDLQSSDGGLPFATATSLTTLTTTVGAAGAGLTEAGGTGDHLTAMPWNAAWDAEVESEVNDAIDTAISELGVGAPTATPTIRTGMMLMYMALRNKAVTQTSGTDALEIYNDAGTIIAKKLLTDVGGDYTAAEMTSG